LEWSGRAEIFDLSSGSRIDQRSDRVPQTVNVGNVAADPPYLTAFNSTRSEIIVPVFENTGEIVIGRKKAWFT
jgi:putative methionine-R-sulfoxide reductase with GAF domain